MRVKTISNQGRVREERMSAVTHSAHGDKRVCIHARAGMRLREGGGGREGDTGSNMREEIKDAE